MATARDMMRARDLLRQNLASEMKELYGVEDQRYIEELCDSWMDDDNNSAPRFHDLERFMPEAARVLDMAAGCGTCVYYGLLRGFDMYGIEPSSWKNRFNATKAMEYGYPEDWPRRFIEAVGEDLPFPDDDFDAVTSYQTLEHVRDARKCLEEMVRVTRLGGVIHLRCPDYRGTYEGHYRLPWLPLLPGPLARVYLRLAGRPAAGLETLQYITRKKILGWLQGIESTRGWTLEVTDVDDYDRRARMEKKGIVPTGARLLRKKATGYLKSLFRAETRVNLLIRVSSKMGAPVCPD